MDVASLRDTNTYEDDKMNRRDFCKYASVIGGSAILLPLVNACRRQQTDTPTITPTVAAPPVRLSATSVQVLATDPPPTVGEAAPTTMAPTVAPEATDATVADSNSSSFSQIALVKDDDRSVGVAKAMALLEAKALSGKDVLLKPNFNSADPSPGSTHPDILRALLIQLREMGAGHVTMADRSGMGIKPENR